MKWLLHKRIGSQWIEVGLMRKSLGVGMQAGFDGCFWLMLGPLVVGITRVID